MIYPLLIAALPAVGLKAANIATGFPDEILAPVALTIAATATIWMLAYALIKNAHKAAFIAASVTAWFFSFGTVSALLSILKIPEQIFVFPYTFLWGGITAFCLLKIKDGKVATPYLNTLTAFLLVYNATVIATRCVQISALSDPLVKANVAQDQNVRFKPEAKRRDIYYIILDALGSSSLFRDYYNYDNSAFIQKLQSKGFVIPPDSVSNYDATVLSLSSSLNMRQITDLEKTFGQWNDISVLGRLIKENRVVSLLKRNGYKFVNVSSGVFFSDDPAAADVTFRENYLSVFNVALLDGSVLVAVPGYLDWLADQVRAQRLCFFKKLNQIQAISGPKFVFAHVLLPHPPFLFSRNGESKVRMQSFNIFNPEGYLEQSMFTEHLAAEAVDKLTSGSGSSAEEDNRPVIIMQGDHGPFYTEDQPTALYCSTRFRIFNAYLLPGVDKSAIYPTITPVNSFRTVFDRCFGTSFGTVKDDSFYSPQSAYFKFTKANELILPKSAIPALETKSDPPSK